MGKHTQGPWSHDGDGDIVGADESYVAYGHGGQRAIGSDADAALIAAAPELLEALVAVLNAGRGTSGRIILDAEDEALARAAIARARGEA
jgi:hypothetical protein